MLSHNQACMVIRSRRSIHHERLRKTASGTAADMFRLDYFRADGPLLVGKTTEQQEVELAIRSFDTAIAGGMICC